MTVKTDRLVTLFGGGGFIGRYVAQALFKAGARVRIAEREPRRAFSLRPLCGLGQIQFIRADIDREREVAAAVAGADAVINLVGILKGNFHAVHVRGAAQRRRRGRGSMAPHALVHLSAIGADPESPSDYGRSKGEGEAAVRAAFPGATIIRPSIVFGPEDNFVNRFANMARLLPVVPVIRGAWKLQPVFAADLGKAIAAAALEPAAHAGRTYELGGPQVFTMREFNDWICRAIGHESKAVIEVPDAFARLGRAAVRLGAGRADHLGPVADAADATMSRVARCPASRPSASVRRRWPRWPKPGCPIYRRHGRWAQPPVLPRDRRPIELARDGRVDSRRAFRQGSALPIWRLPTDRWPSG